MADLDFPASPINNDTYSANGSTWMYSSSKTAWIDTTLVVEYPVGHIYMATVSTNPNTLLGYGTWVAFAAGRALIGVGTSTATTATTWTNGETAGSETHTITTAQLPVHNHGINMTTRALGSSANNRVDNGGTDTTTSSEGGGGSHNNVQPSYGVYMFERTV